MLDELLNDRPWMIVSPNLNNDRAPKDIAASARFICSLPRKTDSQYVPDIRREKL